MKNEIQTPLFPEIMNAFNHIKEPGQSQRLWDILVKAGVKVETSTPYDDD